MARMGEIESMKSVQSVDRILRSLRLNSKRDPNDTSSSVTLNEAQSPYKAEVWRKLTLGERLRRSWRMRSRIPNLQAVHDRKLFSKP
jgi:hypothetical protein